MNKSDIFNSFPIPRGVNLPFKWLARVCHCLPYIAIRMSKCNVKKKQIIANVSLLAFHVDDISNQ